MRAARPTLAVAVATAVGGAVLGGCGVVSGFGGDDLASYCEDLESAQQQFAALGAEQGETAPDPEQLEATVDVFRDLGDAAPEDVAADWRVVVDNLDQREAVLSDAGMTWADLAASPEADPPSGVTDEELAEVGRELSQLDTDEFTAANDAISTHAAEECGLEPPAAEG